MDASNKIKAIRILRGFSQSYMAEKLNMSQRAYSKIELSQSQLNWEKLKRISELLNVGVWELVDQNKKYSPTEEDSRKNVDLLQQLIDQYENRIITLELEIIRLKNLLSKD